MSILKKLGLGPKDAAEAVVKTAEGVADIVERWAPSDEKKHEMTMEVSKLVNESIDRARTFNPKSEGGGFFLSAVNVITDAYSRLIRPTVTLLLIGGVFGWWALDTSHVDPVVMAWGEVVLGYWFGYRALARDLPELIKALKEARK